MCTCVGDQGSRDLPARDEQTDVSFSVFTLIAALIKRIAHIECIDCWELRVERGGRSICVFVGSVI